MSEDDRYFAEIITGRRHMLGLTQGQVREAGGPSPSIQSQVENDRPMVMSDKILAQFDRGLDWIPGTSRAYFHREELPRPPRHLDESPSLPTPLPRAASLAETMRAEFENSTTMNEDISEILRKLNDLDRSTEIIEAVQSLAVVVDQLSTTVQRVVELMPQPKIQD